MVQPIPVYDIESIDHRSPRHDYLIDRFSHYLGRYYSRLHLAHRHSFYHFVVFTGGKGWHSIDFKRFPVRRGQAYFMVPGQVHSWHFEDGVDGYIVHFSAAFFNSFLQNGSYLDQFSFFRGDVDSGVCQLGERAQGRILPLLEDLLKEGQHPLGLGLDLVRLRLLELFILIEQDCPKKTVIRKPAQKMALLRSFQKLIEENFSSLKLPKQYAEKLHVTPNYLNGVCQDLLGKTAGMMIRERIMLEAKRLLTHADMSSAEIAYALNFSDSSYFNRYFRLHVGITPEEFRRKFLDNELDELCALCTRRKKQRRA